MTRHRKEYMKTDKWLKMWEQLEDEQDMRKFFESIATKGINNNNHDENN